MVRSPAHNASSYIWRLNSPAAKYRPLILHRRVSTTASQSYASAAGVVRSVAAKAPRAVDFVPSTQPPSARPVETRKSQLIRSYTSLLRSSPLILFFQHSNLTAVEWAAVRRELRKALVAVQLPPTGSQSFDVTPLIQLQVIRTNMLDVALKIVEFYDAKPLKASAPSSGAALGRFTHDLSMAAYETVRQTKAPPESSYAQLAPLLVGPIAALVFPAVSPAHLSAALSVLSPSPPRFRAPSRKKNPGYHEPICQTGLAKLMLIGGRIEGSVFDHEGINWVGSIEGGIDGLRAQLISMLQSAGAGLTTTLESGSRSLWLTLEGRKCQLEEGAKEVEGKEEPDVEK